MSGVDRLAHWQGRLVLGRLDDLVRAETPRANAETFHAAVHDSLYPLDVSLEPPARHVVRVADVSPERRAFSAYVATIGHGD